METASEKKQLEFMLAIKDFPVLLNKSQLPAIKAKKVLAMTSAEEKLRELGHIFTQKDGLGKKISRMKADVKLKSDKKKTGNEKIVLKEWEKILLDLMGGESNPTISQLSVCIINQICVIN